MKYDERDIEKDPRSMPPAEGERRAIVGYYNQYDVSAFIIIRSLRIDKLKWIKIADPEAKHLDDFQISDGSIIGAYQIKWSQYPNSFTFNDLIKKSNKSPSLIFQLAEGWKHFCDIYHGKRTVVHLITNNYPSKSTSTKMPCEEPSPNPCHFAAFINQAWKQFKKEGIIPTKWMPTWNKLQVESGLNENEFKKFVLDCELDFEYKVNTPDDQREKEIFENDLKDVNHVLFKSVAAASRPVKLNRKELIDSLNWSLRTDFRSIHEFPVDEILYHPISSNVNQLNVALKDLKGGYIGVFGTPGSGKSTFLSKFLRSREERVIFYYAYVPDSHDSILKRGESENFLHDIVLSIRHEGFNVGENINLDVNQLSRYFLEQIDLLHEDWKENGRKTIFLIDGLDHIEREQNPRDSLLNYLPSPDRIPEGLYFVLGSQTNEVLNSKIKHTITKENRTIIMNPLSKKGVFDILDKAKLSIPTEEQKEKIFSLSDGHPLALSYILHDLKNATEEKEIDEILNSTEKYEGDILAQYESYWSKIEDNGELIHLIGLLCRFRRSIDIPWIKTWAEWRLLKLFIRKFMRYFRIEEDRWYFFHNSFRLFLQKKTVELIPGTFDSDQNRAFHQEIAEKCFNTKNNLYWSWEELYHRAKADEHHEVLEKASQSYFREQFFNFRPIDAIRTDINFALESAAVCQNPVEFIRLLFISSEISEREVNLDKKEIISILFSLDENQFALEYIRDGNRLRIEPEDALKLIPDLLFAGLNEEAKNIFELSEPLNILYSSNPIENDYDDKKSNLLESWANTAIYFKDINTIIKIIRQIEKIPDRTRIKQINDPDPSRYLQDRILFSIGMSLLKDERWDELSKIFNAFNVNQNDLKWLFYLFVNSWEYSYRNGHEEIAGKIFNKAMEKFEKITFIDYQMVIRVAEAFYQISKDKNAAKNHIGDVPQPKLKTDPFGSSYDMGPFMYRFKLNRLLYALGSKETPEEVIPDPDDLELEGIVEFERDICQLAQIWADAWENKTLNDDVINEEIPKFFNLFHMGNREAIDDHLYGIKQRMGDFCLLIVETMSKHGLSVLKSLPSIFEEEWNNEEFNKFWPADVRRQTIVKLADKGINHSWAVNELKKIENSFWEGYNIYGRVEECLKQSKAWIEIDEVGYAYKTLKKMYNVSFGVYEEKDYQLEEWINWLDKFIEINPGRAEELITYFAEHITLISEYVGASTYYGASKRLLTATFRWNPFKAIELSLWLLDQMMITQDEIIDIFLEETLKSDNADIYLTIFTLTKFLFPITTHSNHVVIDLLLKEINAKFGTEKATEAASYLVSKVRIYAEKDDRPTWFYLIKKSMDNLGLNIKDAGIKSKDIQLKENDGFTYNLLKLENSTLDENAVKNRVSSMDDFIELLRAGTKESYFDWTPIINKLLNDLNSEDILKLSDIIIKHENIRDYEIPELLSSISQALSNNDDLGLAIKIGKESLKFSEPRGWGNWGGTSRIEAFKALIKADKDQFRPILYETLINDLKNRNIDPKTVTFNLDQILPLITDEIPIKDIWPELENHIHILFENYPSNDFVPFKFNEENVKKNASEALAHFIVSCVNHPVRLLSQMSIHISANLLLKGDKSIQNSINEFLEKNESYQENILIILDAVSLKDHRKVEIYREKIIELQNSPNYLIRRIAWSLCRCIGCNFAKEKNKTIKLPKIYYEQLQNRNIFERRNDVERPIGEPLLDSEDPMELIAPFNFHVHVISQVSGIPEINLCHRAVQIMNQLENHDLWSSEGERKLRTFLDSSGLRFSFIRPRAVVTRRAIFHIISELIDGDVLNPFNLVDIDQFFKFYDPFMIMKEPSKRPQYVETAYEEEPIQEWMENLSDSIYKTNFKIFDGMFILAENTKLKFIDHNSKTEIRKSHLIFNSNKNLNQEIGDSFFYKVNLCNLNEYLDENPQTEPIPLIIQNRAHEYDSRGSNWIALNPIIAYQLGWSLDDSGLFRWVDEDGKLMIESVWWVDGILDKFKPTFYEVGEGWLILASKDAIKAIKSQYGLIKRFINVERNYYDDNGFLKSNSILTEHSVYNTYLL